MEKELQRLEEGFKVKIHVDSLRATLKKVLNWKSPGYDDISYLPNPSTQAGYDTRSIFKRSLTGLNLEFSFS